MALCLTVPQAVALSPLPPCDGIESGMFVSDAQTFGFDGSHFVVERYANNEIWNEPDANGILTGTSVPPPISQLAGFNGYRIMDCRSREFLAINDRADYYADDMLATEFLREKVQDERSFTLSDVRRAADAIYRRQDIRMIALRETEQTCSCRIFGGL